MDVDICHDCNGTGIDVLIGKCQFCHGLGMIDVYEDDYDDDNDDCENE